MVPNELFRHIFACLDDPTDPKFHSGVVLQKLRDAFDHNGCEPHKFVLRMTKAPTNACIDFYCDGSYATSTDQIALNESYKGGRLCFYKAVSCMSSIAQLGPSSGIDP